MRQIGVLYIPVLALGFFALWGRGIFAEGNLYKGLRINEVQISGGETGKSNEDFIELYNAGNTAIFIKNISIRKIKTGKTFTFKDSDSIIKITQERSLSPGEYFVWASNKESEFPKSIYADVANSSYLSDGYQVGIFGIDEVLVGEAIDYGSILQGGEKGSFSFDEEGGVFRWTTHATPRRQNEFDGDEEPLPADGNGAQETSHSVRLNEVFPNPEGKDAGKEFIEIYNAGIDEVDISGWRLRDKNLQEKSQEGYIFPNGSLHVGEYRAVYQSEYGFSLNSTNESLELLDAVGAPVDTMSYTTSKEGVSWGFDGSRWRASLVPTPGAPNQLNGEPQSSGVSVPEEGYVDVWVYFSAGGSDADGDALKYRWDFGDGHKSYKQTTKHRYKEEGEYTVTLHIDDGKEPQEETYTIDIESYPHRKVKIIAFEPNPKGKDAEGEWIRVKNESKKTVDLNGWSVATGKSSKKLTNHPIKTSVKIKKGKEVIITRSVSKITLNNKKGVVELRYPDGERADRVRYEQKDGIGEGDVYRKEKKKGWLWDIAEAVTKKSVVATAAATVIEAVNDANTFIDPVSDALVGEAQEISRVVARLGWEYAFDFPNAASSYVAGATSVRLGLNGNRYVFVESHASEHWLISWWRSVKVRWKMLEQF